MSRPVLGAPERGLALVRSDRVMSSTANLATWVLLASSSVLNAADARLCEVTGLDALALRAQDVLSVGTGCRRAGQSGSALRVYTLAPGSNTWVKSRSMEMPTRVVVMTRGVRVIDAGVDPPVRGGKP